MNKNIRKLKTTKFFRTFICLATVLMIGASCQSYETYAEMKDKEKDAISGFLIDNIFTGPITVISETEFILNEYTTDTTKNEFVLFQEDGIYMQICRKGAGKTMKKMCEEQIVNSGDSTINKVILCRFLEYDIENGTIDNTNWYTSGIVDKMLCSYSYASRSFTGTFTEGYMFNTISSTGGSPIVPSGWMKPLEYINLAKTAGSGEIARVKLIVPHSSGTTAASSSVLPMYYDITYQLGK